MRFVQLFTEADIRQDEVYSNDQDAVSGMGEYNKMNNGDNRNGVE